MLFLAVAKGSFSDHRSPLVGARFPPSFSLSKAALENNTNNGDGHDQDEDCKAGAICVGPTGDHYSIGHEPGVMFTSRFDVPELPKSHDSRKTCYYGKCPGQWPVASSNCSNECAQAVKAVGSQVQLSTHR